MFPPKIGDNETPLPSLPGEGAQCSIFLSKLCPSYNIEVAFPNYLMTQCLKDLVAVQHEQITHHGLMYNAVFFTSKSITSIELSAMCL
jgi:hypothetical protein